MNMQGYDRPPPQGSGPGGQYPASPPASYPQPPGHQYQFPPSSSERRTEFMAIISLVCGVASMLLIFPGCCCYGAFISPVPGVAAVVLGILARGKIREDPVHLTGDSFALVGIVTGGIGVAAFIVYLIFYMLGTVTDIMSTIINNLRR